ncbi:MAG TPA: hypothetical protein VJU15_06725 [Gemmatimonadales bacterium]|nr:hypothetical protein [Gemmatimonadales bacterium]
MRILPLLFLSLVSSLEAQGRSLPFDSGWDFSGAETRSIGTFLGRESLRLRNGVAIRPDVSLEDGTIDFDLAVTDARSFVYIQFRQVGDGENEEIYLRPHKTNLPDAVQYAPVFRGQSAWQLFHGPGNTARVPIPRGAWVHVRLVLKGQRAAFYLGDTTKPVMVIPELARPARAGSIALRAFTPQGGAPEGEFVAAYSNVVVRPGVGPATMPAAPERPVPANLVKSWQLSPAFVPPQGRLRALPADLLANRASWPSHPVDREGRLILDRYLSRAGQDARSAAVLRLVVPADGDTVRRLDLGFSDEYLLFVNGRPVSGGDAFYRFDNPRGDGVIHAGQSVAYLPLHRGDNEVLIVLLDVFGGWGIIGVLQ